MKPNFKLSIPTFSRFLAQSTPFLKGKITVTIELSFKTDHTQVERGILRITTLSAKKQPPQDPLRLGTRYVNEAQLIVERKPSERLKPNLQNAGLVEETTP